MSTNEKIQALVDHAVEYGKSKSDSIIARVVHASDSQVRFSQSAIDIAKRWESVELELFAVVKGAKAGATIRSVSTADDVKKAVDDLLAFNGMLPDSMFFAGLEDNVVKYKEPEQVFDSKVEDFVETSSETVNSIIDAAIGEGAKRVAGSLMVTNT